ETSINNVIETFSREGRMRDLKNIMFANQEMRSRQDDLMFHPGILMEIAALSIIRDDEDPYTVNDLLTSEKVEVFTKQGHNVDFFLQSGLTEYLPNSEELRDASIEKLQKYREMYDKDREMIKKKQEAYDKIVGEIKSTP